MSKRLVRWAALPTFAVSTLKVQGFVSVCCLACGKKIPFCTLALLKVFKLAKKAQNVRFDTENWQDIPILYVYGKKLLS